MRPARLDRSAPPLPGAIHPFRFPSFLRHTLPSGFAVYAARLEGFPLVTLELIAPAGAICDPQGYAGLATLTGSLLDEGTERRSALETAFSVERLGGHLATGADWDVGYASASLLSLDTRAGLELLAELVTLPSFPAAEVDRLRHQRLADILRRSHTPTLLADDQLNRAIYAGTPYGISSLGNGASVARLDRDRIVDFYRHHYPPSGLTLVAVGDLDPEELLHGVESVLAAYGGRGAAAAEPGDAAVNPFPPELRPLPLTGIAVHLVDRPGASQTEMRLGHPGVPRTHPDYTAMGMMNTLLGGKFTSRINLNLRERHGYTYGASSRLSGRLGPGPFSVSTAVATESVGAAAREVLSELRRIREGLVDEVEMEETRSYLLGVFPYTLQTVDDLAKRLEDLAVYRLPDDYYDRFTERISALTRADILRVAQEHLDPDHLAVIAVGPADILRPQLEGLGPVSVHTPQEVEDLS